MEELDRITIDPEVNLDQPTIRGMRITVSLILKLIANKMSQEEGILKAYPELEEEDIFQALKYAALAIFRKNPFLAEQKAPKCITFGSWPI